MADEPDSSVAAALRRSKRNKFHLDVVRMHRTRSPLPHPTVSRTPPVPVPVITPVPVPVAPPPPPPPVVRHTPLSLPPMSSVIVVTPSTSIPKKTPTPPAPAEKASASRSTASKTPESTGEEGRTSSGSGNDSGEVRCSTRKRKVPVLEEFSYSLDSCEDDDEEELVGMIPTSSTPAGGSKTPSSQSKYKSAIGEYPCSRCPAFFETRVGLTNHLKLHGASKTFDCVECDFSCTNRKTMRQHKRVHGAAAPSGASVVPAKKRKSVDVKVESLQQISACELAKFVIFQRKPSLALSFLLTMKEKNKEIYYPLKDERELLADFNWNDFIENPKLHLITQRIQLHLRYGNISHHLEVDYNELPFSKILELNIEDAKSLTLSVNYVNKGFIPVKIREYNGVRRKRVKINVTIGIDLLPSYSEVAVTTQPPIEYKVFSIDWDNKTKRFTGIIITQDNVFDSVADSENVADVFKALAAASKPMAKLRGVIANYWNTNEFPVDTHQKVVKALPSSSTKLIVGQIHAYFPLHFQNSGIRVADGKAVILTDWSKDVCLQTYYYFNKEINTYIFNCESFATPTREDTDIVIVTDAKPTDEQKEKAKTLYPNMKIHFSRSDRLVRTSNYEYAWHYFNGKNYDGYLVPWFPELSVWLRNNALAFITSNTICACNGYTSNIVINSKEGSSSRDLPAYFAKNHHAYAKYTGFAKPVLYARFGMNNCNLVDLKTVIGSDLVPTATVTGIESSLQNLPAPFIQMTGDNLPDASAVFVINISVIRSKCEFWFRALYDNKLTNSQNMTIDHLIYCITTITPFVKTTHILVFAADYLTMSERLKYFEIFNQLSSNVLFFQSCQLFALRFYQKKVQLNVGKSAALHFDFSSMLLTKHENGLKCNNLILIPKVDVDTLSKNKKYEVETTLADTTSEYLYNDEEQLTLESYNEFVKSISNGNNFHGYRIDDYDLINYEAEWDDQKVVIHHGIENLPFEVTKTLHIGETSSLKVYATICNEKYLVKHFIMKTKKHRQVTLTIKQLNLFEITASADVLEVVPAKDKETKTKTSTSSEVSQSTDEPVSSSTSPSPEVTLTFTTNNRILVNAGPDYTGEPELAAYFRMESSKFGPVVTIGEKAKAAYKKHPKTVIYDIPGLLAADSNQAYVSPTWTFETSRAADGTLLIYLGDDAYTSPVSLFATVVQSAFPYIKSHVTEAIETIKIQLPVGVTVSKTNLSLISKKIGVELQV
uniref:C2H2-type domain-containing protein n=1 Tax=Panagrellus redivivus TaxID=6233 RepID=A0A7E4W4I6_PANRE